MKTLCVSHLLALALVAVSPGAAVAATINIDVEYVYEGTSEEGCVKKVVVAPDQVYDPQSKKDVVIQKSEHDRAPQIVAWNLVPTAATASGVTWTVEKVGSGYDNCPKVIYFTGAKATCTPQLGSGSQLDEEWRYTIKAVKKGCGDVAPDPAIIFRGGGGGIDILQVALYVALAAVALVLVILAVVRMRKARAS